MFIELIILKIAVTINFVKKDKANIGELSKMFGNSFFGMIFEPGDGVTLHDRRFGEETTLPIKVWEEPRPK
jgi:hypothetical protein